MCLLPKTKGIANSDLRVRPINQNILLVIPLRQSLVGWYNCFAESNFGSYACSPGNQDIRYLFIRPSVLFQCFCELCINTKRAQKIYVQVILVHLHPH